MTTRFQSPNESNMKPDPRYTPEPPYTWRLFLVTCALALLAGTGAAMLGCAAMPLYVDGEDDGHVGDIERVWGPVELAESPECAVTLVPMAPDETVECNGTQKQGCQKGRTIYCQPPADDPNLCAHEFGHVFLGQEHLTEPNDNVMYQYRARDTDQTLPEQRKRHRALATTLQVCRKAKGLR